MKKELERAPAQESVDMVNIVIPTAPAAYTVPMPTVYKETVA